MIYNKNTAKKTAELLLQIKAIKLEGRQRRPAYVEQIVRVWREALDAYAIERDNFTPRSEWMDSLSKVSEGTQTTLGAYSRPWQ